jgi:hypothetical protein
MVSFTHTRRFIEEIDEECWFGSRTILDDKEGRKILPLLGLKLQHHGYAALTPN